MNRRERYAGPQDNYGRAPQRTGLRRAVASRIVSSLLVIWVIASCISKSGLYRFSGGIFWIGAANFAWAAGSTGLCLTLVLAGFVPRKLSPVQFLDGRMGLGTNPAAAVRADAIRGRCQRTSGRTYIHKCKMRASS